MGVPAGYRRTVSETKGVVGVVLPGPQAARRYWDQDDFLQASCHRDREIRQLIHQLSQATIVGVPLVDCDRYEQWCAQTDVPTTDPQSRARWAATQIMERTYDDHGMPVVRGVHPLQAPGDSLAISLALATGWDGYTPAEYLQAPPGQGWSRISTDLVGKSVEVALRMERDACQVAWVHLMATGEADVAVGLDGPGRAPGEGWRHYQCRNLALWWR